jgi:CzcA family heavy metal efflux pump
MLRRIIGSSLRFCLVVAAVAALLLVFGFARLEPQPVDILPEFSRPFVEIQSEALGLSAEEVEAMVTTPLEADMLNGTPWVDEIRSTSIPGLSSVVLIFEKGTDIMHARQVVQEKLTQVFLLPNVTKSPIMINPVSSTSRFMTIGLGSETMSLIDMSVLARWTIAPRLMGLPGVANVSIWGERKWQLQVQVNPEQLRDQNVTLGQVIKTAGNALWASPLSYLEASTPGTGGWIETANQRLGVRHILPIQKAGDLGKVTLEGSPTKHLSDVATVVEDHQPLIGDAIVKDAPALTLVIEKFPWADTTDVTEEVETALANLRPGLSGLEMDSTLFRPATYLTLADDNLSLALLMTAVLVALAFLVFHLNWRSALISSVAALLSVITAGTVLYLRGVTLDLITIAGFMIAFGIIIDDAIIDVDNIARRLRQAREDGSDKSTATIILEAAFEVRSPLLYATIMMALAVTPIIALEGVAGSIFHPLASAYLLAVFASMVVALTVTPALGLLLLRNGSLPRSEPPTPGLLRGLHNALFGWAARTPVRVLVGVGTLVVVGLTSGSILRQESLLPDFRETDLVVRLTGSPGASHAAMSRLTTMVSRELRTVPGVRNVSAHVGRAISSDKRNNINAAELSVSINPAADYDATVAAIREVADGYVGLAPEVLTYLQAKLRDELSGTGESLVVRVYGEDLDVIRKKADEISQLLTKVNGVVGSAVQYPDVAPTVEIEVDIERARRHGLAPGDVRRAASSLVSGIEVGSLFEAQKVFDVVVYGTPETRHSLTSLENLIIDTPAGGHVSLKDVASVRIAPAVTEIQRDAVARRMDVTFDVRGRDLTSVAADIEEGIRQVDFPLEYRAELRGEYAVRQAAQLRVAAFAVAAGVGIFLLLQAFFKNWSLATFVLLSLPAGLSGGALAVLLTERGFFSLGSIAGFIVLMGIAMRNALVLFSHYRQLEGKGEAFSAALVARGTEEQSAPILMNAITTALAFLPFAFFGSIAGLEVAHPMAIVVLGGLVTTTLVSLVGVPAMCVFCGTAVAEPDMELVEDVPANVVTV